MISFLRTLAGRIFRRKRRKKNDQSIYPMF
jgi:hypothetical protein